MCSRIVASVYRCTPVKPNILTQASCAGRKVSRVMCELSLCITWDLCIFEYTVLTARVTQWATWKGIYLTLVVPTDIGTIF